MNVSIINWDHNPKPRLSMEKKIKTIAPTISDLLDTCCKTFWSTKHHSGQATDMPFPSQIRLYKREWPTKRGRKKKQATKIDDSFPNVPVSNCSTTMRVALWKKKMVKNANRVSSWSHQPSPATSAEILRPSATARPFRSSSQQRCSRSRWEKAGQQTSPGKKIIPTETERFGMLKFMAKIASKVGAPNN